MRSLSLIAAMDKNGLIGKDNSLPWKLPAYLKIFKSITLGSTLIMGRKTFESLKKPLENRKNVVITSQLDYKVDGVIVVNSIEEAIQKKDKVFIIGGGQIYQTCIDKGLIEDMFITHVDGDFIGDTYFPFIDWSNWDKKSEINYMKDEKNPYNFKICYYKKNI